MLFLYFNYKMGISTIAGTNKSWYLTKTGSVSINYFSSSKFKCL